MPSLVIDDFSGGLNLRDSPNRLALTPAETPDALNFTLDERGSLKWRNGCVNQVALPGVSGKIADLFYSAALDQWLCARETAGTPNTLKLFSRPGDLSGSWTDRGTINSVVTARAAFVDFPGAAPKVVIATDILSGATKGIWTWDGTTLTNVLATFGGNGLALWQDRVFVIGYPTSDASGNPTSMRWCDPKDPTAWTATNVQQFREKDAAALTGIGVAGGGLIVFKKRSHYRVADAASGAYTTIDASAGCVNPRAVAALRGRLYFWGADGIYESDGVGAARNVGDKLRPIYLDPVTDGKTICAGVVGDHVLFGGAIRALGSLVAVVELDPRNGWVMAHQLASGNAQLGPCAAKESTLYAQAGDALWTIFDSSAATATDDGILSASRYRSPWLLPNSGMLSRLHRCRAQGLITGLASTAILTLRLYKDWNEASYDSYDLSGLRQVAGADQLAVDLQSLGHGASFALSIIPANHGDPVSIRALQLIDQALQWPSPGYPKRGGLAITGHGVPVPGGGGGAPPTS